MKILSIIGIIVVTVISGCTDQGGQEMQKEQIGKAPGAIPGNVPGGVPVNIPVNIKDEKKSGIGELHEKNLEWGISMLLPDGWNTKVFPACTGLVATDNSNNARSVIFLNELHQSVDPLPPGVTPENYVEKYMQDDFKSMSDVKIIKYEDVDLSALKVGGADVKAMRVSFKNNGVSAIGSFTVNTYGWSGSSAVGYVWGITSTEKEFYADGGKLLTIISSIKYEEKTLEECRKAQKEAWKIED